MSLEVMEKKIDDLSKGVQKLSVEVSEIVDPGRKHFLSRAELLNKDTPNALFKDNAKVILDGKGRYVEIVYIEAPAVTFLEKYRSQMGNSFNHLLLAFPYEKNRDYIFGDKDLTDIESGTIYVANGRSYITYPLGALKPYNLRVSRENDHRLVSFLKKNGIAPF